MFVMPDEFQLRTAGSSCALLIVIASYCPLASAQNEALSTTNRQGARPPGIEKVPDPPTIVKVKIDPAVDPPQFWGGGGVLTSTVLDPAPEVVRLWDPSVTAGVRVSSNVLRAVADLDSREFTRRQAASLRLAEPAVTAEEIFALLVRGDLSDEQRERLLTVARDKVLALPRGALGIRMQPSGDPLHPGVEIQLLLPGLPAERVLKIGDRIERIDDRPISTSNDLVEIIQSKAPSESVKLSVSRQQRDERGKPKLDDQGSFIEDRFEVDIELTSAADLDRFEGQFPNATRSTVLERRLLALREAQARFAPARVKVMSRALPDAPQPSKGSAPRSSSGGDNEKSIKHRPLQGD